MKNVNFKRNNIGTVLFMLVLTVSLAAGSALFTDSFAAVKSTKVRIDGKRYTAIKTTDTTLYSGEYALGDDIVLNNSLDVSYIDDDSNPTPTTIILNGYSLTIKDGSTDPVIKVSNGATLILKDKAGADGKVVAVYGAVSVVDGYLVLENADLSSSENAVIGAERAEITIGGDSKISGNDSEWSEAAINCGESVKITVKDNALVTENRVAVNLSSDTSITLAGNAKISGNSVAGLLCNENQIIYVDNAGDSMLCEISVKDETGTIHDAKLVLSENYKEYKKCFIGGENRDISSVVSNEANNCAIVKALSCSGHKYTYSTDGYTIKAICSECGTESRISFSNKAYFDDKTGIYYISDIDEEISINDSLWDSYKVSVYPLLVYKNTDSGEYGAEVPANPGNYAVKLVLLSEEGNIDSTLAETKEFTFQKTCSQHEWEYVVDGNSICAKCKNCGGTFATSSLSVNHFDLPENSEENITLYECCWDEFAFDLSVSGMNLGLGTFKVLYGYTQNDGSVKYTLTAPSEEGDYLIRLAVLKIATRPSSAITSTAAISYSYRYHNWEYQSDEESIHACCGKCGESVSVRLDSSEIMYASRQYANNGSGTFDGNIFSEDGWSSVNGIMPYHVCYRSCDQETYTEDRSLLKNSPVDFYAKIVLENNDESHSIYQSTDEKHFYFSTIDVEDSASGIVYQEFGAALMKEPSKSEDLLVCVFDKSKGTYDYATTRNYYVSCREELYWVAKNADANAYITLTDDIIVNPITISDDGEDIYTANTTIYTWTGLGTLQNPYTGAIIGNGHTIYGLCSPEGYKNEAGLIAYGEACDIDDLTIKDSVFSGWNTGAIIGFAKTIAHLEYITMNNCNVEHCNIHGGGSTGGLIGFADIKAEMSGFSLYNCVSDNYVKGSNASGGIIGESDVYIDGSYTYLGYDNFLMELDSCVNLSDVYGTDEAGGMIGCVWGTNSYTTQIKNCRNLGRIESSLAAGGMVGSSYNDENTSVILSLDLNNNVNLGYIECIQDCAGGMVGICGSRSGGTFGLVAVKCVDGSGNYYFGANDAVAASYGQPGAMLRITDGSDLSHSDLTGGVGKLTSALARKANLCNGFRKDDSGNIVLGQSDGSNIYGHVPGDWEIVASADCSNGGAIVRKCLVCGETLDTESCSSHGHYYLDGTCVYCEESDPDQTGSVFLREPNITYISIGVVFIAAVSGGIIRRRRKQ